MNDYYLITGGAGFIGSHLVEAFVKAGKAVRVLDDLSTGRIENLEPFMNDIDFVEGDIRDRDVVKRAHTGVTHVLHQAALPSVPRSVKDRSNTAQGFTPSASVTMSMSLSPRPERLIMIICSLASEPAILAA